LDFPWWISIPIGAVFVLLITLTIKMLTQRKERHLYVSQWYLLGASVWFPLLYVAATIVIHTPAGIGIAKATTSFHPQLVSEFGIERCQTVAVLYDAFKASTINPLPANELPTVNLVRTTDPLERIMIEISPGELLDRITILKIKTDRLTTAESLRKVKIELDKLLELRGLASNLSVEFDELEAKLRQVNERLWDAEDALRAREATKAFDASFIALARSIYHLNDERSAIKSLVNEIVGSPLTEVKQYPAYSAQLIDDSIESAPQ
jgi:hypothetical protein